MKANLYLVPHDFSSVGQAALNYAVHLGKYVEAEIRIVHIAASEKSVPEAQQKLTEIVAQLPVSPNLEFTSEVRVGNIFTDINKIAMDTEAQLIIMGTHGIRGFQKFFGSHAIKVINSTNVPFLIVQEDTPVNAIKHIAVPIDISSESLQITNIAADLGKMLNAKLSVIYEPVHDFTLNNRMNIRLGIVRESYDNKGVDYEISELKGSGSSLKKINHFMADNECGLVAIAYFSNALFPQFDTFAQNLITNKQKLPCLIVSAISTSNSYF